MLADVIDCLACPHCGENLSISASTVRCATGHSFDIARQGYVSLLPGDAHTGTADTTAMVAARETFLAAGHYAEISRAVADATERALVDAGPGCVIDVGSGTGYYLAAVLERLPERVGIALDISKYALRRAARAHPHIGAVAGDVWRRLPVRTGSVAAVLDVFAPRNAAEFRRVLAPDGVLIVVIPDRNHLARLVETLDLLDVDVGKEARLATQLAQGFERVAVYRVEGPLELTHAEVDAAVAMGPSAHHVDPADIDVRVAALAEPVRTRLSVTVAVYKSAR
ncbi:MAG: methyltransferase domain-containing protein [Coriobacteriia bacterium]|nr:methyltransferase domain-containing protein [Coriobacteriia bacterium]